LGKIPGNQEAGSVAMPDYRALVQYIVERLVTRSDEVDVRSSEEDGIIKITIRVASEDIGRIIGKKGATINAIRLVTKSSAVKSNDKVDVDIEE
jgi:predicted RNA-binding protein YlqC (UPF0109 family)